MKHMIRILLVLSAVLLFLGGSFTVAGYLMGASVNDSSMLKMLKDQLEDGKGYVITAERLRNKMDKELDPKSIPIQQKIPSGNSLEVRVPRNFEISLSADELILKAYKEKKILIEVDAEKEKRSDVEVTFSRDTLSLISERKIHDGNITVYYPEDMSLELLKISLDAGRIEIQDALCTDEMDITIGAGEMDFDEMLKAKKAILEVGAGKVEIEKMNSDLLCGKCSVGTMNLTMDGGEEDYNYYLECGLGEILIGENSHSSIADSEEISNNHSGKRIELSCGLGEINVQFMR